MSNEEIIKRLGEIEARAERLAKYSSAILQATPRGWTMWLSNMQPHPGYFPTPDAALDEADRMLTRREDSDGILARTLGVEVAA